MFSSFMTNTWIVATIVAVVAGFVGFFVVLRGASFAAHALPLGTFPGAAAANLFGINELAGLIAFSGLGALGINQLGRRGRHDVATALCLVTLLGLGTLFLSMTREYSAEVYSLLFGEVLGVSSEQIWPVAILGALSIGLVILIFQPLLLNSMSPDLAEARGIPNTVIELCFLAVLALATSMALPVVGALLVYSLMVGPAAVARSLTDRPFHAMVISVALSVATVWISIALSYLSDWPIGFFVGTAGALLYATERLGQHIIRAVTGNIETISDPRS